MNQLDRLERLRSEIGQASPGADPQDVGRAALELACVALDGEMYVISVDYRAETLAANPDCCSDDENTVEGPWTDFEPRYCGPWTNTRPCVGDIVTPRRSAP